MQRRVCRKAAGRGEKKQQKLFLEGENKCSEMKKVQFLQLKDVDN